MTFGACWTCDADATGANALDGRAAEETGGVDGCISNTTGKWLSTGRICRVV